MKELDSSSIEPENAFDHTLANSYLGKNLLFGITYCDHNGDVLHQIQKYGEIIEINKWTMTIKVQGDEELFTLPPFVDELELALEGEYKLRSTGEIVTNPDLIGRFQVFAPAPDN